MHPERQPTNAEITAQNVKAAGAGNHLRTVLRNALGEMGKLEHFNDIEIGHLWRLVQRGI